MLSTRPSRRSHAAALPSQALGQHNIFTLPPSPRPGRRTVRRKGTVSPPLTGNDRRRSSVSSGTPSICSTYPSPPNIMLNSPITANIKTQADLTNHYRAYLRALNTRTFDLVGRYVAKLLRVGPASATYTPEDIVADIQGRTIAARLSVEYPVNAPISSTLANSYGHQQTGSLSSTAGESLCDNCSASNPPTPPSTGTGGRSPRVCQVDEMVFYRFDEDWRIVEVNSMVQPRRERDPAKSQSGHERGSSRGLTHARSRSP
ncbi:hypothetical protein A1Q1_08112 [Trichosporon asahii var. asahii CBS 2479]|uniref:Uncharacterized protein n=1 Tax=Trichosporon asahii var. asahii (strain ATCC 90039 / CBS 2479 / JCM 2466 / KCTC 7840 / NBRC 103889/ NCYC 2677 / UAMH 7654) TaxID=1186058 RepID=J6F605_TRIAS|nr:hypothetical protein A1Q1_08112 [Trichosporon asahii var. asahii CBS 2479]EJT50737.1 hypothetical protein A1Q1_08112 [Trichosporon asahii var. asahii CBS 2479]